MEWEGSSRFRRSSLGLPAEIDSLSSNELATDGARLLVSESGSSFVEMIASSSTESPFPPKLCPLPRVTAASSTIRSTLFLSRSRPRSTEFLVDDDRSGSEAEWCRLRVVAECAACDGGGVALGELENSQQTAPFDEFEWIYLGSMAREPSLRLMTVSVSAAIDSGENSEVPSEFDISSNRLLLSLDALIDGASMISARSEEGNRLFEFCCFCRNSEIWKLCFSLFVPLQIRSTPLQAIEELSYTRCCTVRRGKGQTKESSEFAHRFRAVVFPAMSYYYLLLLFPLTCYLLLTRLDPRRPSFLSSTIPFLGSAIPFFTRRWDFITNGIRNQRNGVFRFNLAHLQVIGVGSKEGIEAFFNTKQFSLADGYAILFGSPTAAHEIKSLDKNTQDEAGKGFNRRLIALMKRERFLAQVRRFSPRLYCRRTASIEVTPRSRAD